MSKCISNHGEYSEHEPGDPCPWCGEYDTERIIAERDAAEARIRAVEALLDSEERSAVSMDLGACGIGKGWSAAVSVAAIRRALDGEQ